MVALRLMAQTSMWTRVSVPVNRMARWVSVVQEIESGSKIAAREPKEPRGQQDWAENFHLEDVAIEKVGFARMRVREDLAVCVFFS